MVDLEEPINFEETTFDEIYDLRDADLDLIDANEPLAENKVLRFSSFINESTESASWYFGIADCHGIESFNKENIDFVECFGDGSPKREFLYSDDLADAAIFLMHKDVESFINIGTGIETSIKEIVDLICEIVDYRGRIVWDTTKPNGAPRRVLDVSKLNSLGWKPKTSLKEGIVKIINHLDQSYV